MQKTHSFLTTLTELFFVYFISAFFNIAKAIEFPSDTAFYFSERGKPLGQNTHAAKRGNYVIKTRKSFHKIFPEIFSNDGTVYTGPSYDPATVVPISRRTAKKVERLIHRGAFDDTLVTKNIVPVLDRTILQRMYGNIQVHCSNDDSRNFKEHGGALLPDGTITCISGDISDPRTWTGAALYIKEKALVYYHSHPCGCVERNSNSSYASVEEPNPNKVFFSKNEQTEWICYIQGPSRQDQYAVGKKGVGYVFGMSGKSGLIYIYDHEGVKATLPMSFAKKFRKTVPVNTGRRVRKIDTYTAGLFKNMRLPYLF
jgi:hypothetical protein